MLMKGRWKLKSSWFTKNQAVQLNFVIGCSFHTTQLLGLMFLLQSPEQEPRNPLYVYNTKQQVDARASDSCKSEGLPECQDTVKQMRRDGKCYTWSETLLKGHYVSFNTTEHILNNIVKFFVHGNNTFVVDTTFELTDGLLLCDSSIQYETPLNDSGEHLHFLGLYMRHFNKGHEAYRYSICRLVELPIPFYKGP